MEDPSLFVERRLEEVGCAAPMEANEGAERVVRGNDEVEREADYEDRPNEREHGDARVEEA